MWLYLGLVYGRFESLLRVGLRYVGIQGVHTSSSEWLQWLQWSPHPQLLDVVGCSAVVVVVVAVVWYSGVVLVMCNKCRVVSDAVAVAVVVWCN